MQLDNRKKEVLHAIVDDYVSTNEPVGSKSLIERHSFNVSSATLRNDMAELEHLGLIEKPHTSAGRIPSDKGYREYVNSLMTIEELTPREQLEIEKRIDSSVDEVTDLIKNATHTLSETTGFVSLAMSPRLKKSFLKHDEQIMKISGVIEKHLTGKPLDEITLVTVESAGKNTDVPEPLLKQVLYEAYAAIKQADELNIYLEGEHRMLSLPDFSSLGRARDLLGTLSDSGMVAGYVNEMENAARELGNDDSYMIRIGQEITLEGLDDCSFITATYNLTDSVSGNIGVIGPKRMLYSKVISQIDFVKKKLNEEMKRFT